MNVSTSRHLGEDLGSIAQDAYVYCLPLIILETFRRRRMNHGCMHELIHARKLLNHTHRQITTPNNDTLYSDFWLDLNLGPARITIPGTGERYFSLMLLDYYTNNFAVPGTRTTGPDAVTFTLVGPDASTDGLTGEIIRSPTAMVMGLARVLVDGQTDLAAARAVQDMIKLEAPANDCAEGPLVDRNAPWQDFFVEANRLIRINRPPVTDLAFLRRVARLGIGPDQIFDPSAFSADEAEAIEAGVYAASDRLSRIQTSLARGGRGWIWPRHNLGVYGQDYFLRAAVAVGGLGALPLEEATYLRSGGVNGDLFDGRRMWRLHFPAGQDLPSNGFWSLSMYEPTPQGEFYFVENELNRYAIGDRTPDLKRNPDGSLDIWMSAASPGPDRESNWLPAPPGPFQLFLRAYLPRIELIERRYPVPEPEALEA